jgi:CubicO group peptidase (beta-lactamase class C family)
VTLRQLLWQVTGIPNFTARKGFQSYATTHPGGIEGVLDLIRAKPLEFTPGTKWMYSNSNYALLGQVVAVASGESLEAYIREHIFGPVGMTHSTFIVDERGLSDVATGYTRVDGARASSPPMGNWALGAGSIVSTAEDLAKWDDAFFGGRVIAPADVKLATTPGRLANGSPTDYGFGWEIDSHDGQPCIEHNGGTFGFASVNQNFPGLGEQIIVLVNDVGAGPTSIAAAAFDALNPEVVSTADLPVAGEDTAITKLAQQWWTALMSGKVDRSRLTPAMSKALTPTVLSASGAQLRAFGEPVRWIYRGEQEVSGATVYRYRVAFGSGTMFNVIMALAPDGKLAGYVTRPG